MKIRYFDHAATTKVKEEVLDEMLPFLKDKCGNPSSLYSLGREAKRAIEEARKRVALLINCEPSEIYFTAGGSESDNMAIKGIAYANSGKKGHIITSKIEHPAVLNTCQKLEKQGYRVTYLNVNKDGLIDLEALRRSIRDDTILISIMSVNNEIGTIEPVYEISRIAKIYNIIFHSDSVQACGHVPIDVKKMGIDMLSLSGHKLGAPKGIGALYIKNGIKIEKLIDGGHQERDKRAGTENVPGMVGLGKACEISRLNMNKNMLYLQNLRDYYINLVEKEIPEASLNGSRNLRVPSNANFSFKGIDAQSLLLKLDAKGICASSGSACSSGDISPSHVLTAIGLSNELAKGALRISFGEENTKEDVEYLVESIKEGIRELR